MQPVILIHGGAGNISDARVPDKIRGVKYAVIEGYKVLRRNGSALDAVEAAVRAMEDDEAFNAGFGSVLNLDGEVEMDASIMVGSNLKAGAVSIVKDIAHPITLARLVMEKTPHVILSAEGAKRFARQQGMEILTPGSLISPYAKEALLLHQKQVGDLQLTEIGPTKPVGGVGTVGAVALDGEGRLAVATSTGGINGKIAGRVSDTSQIGSGSYADDEFGAVSTTGHGETIMKFCLAHRIVREMANGLSASAATISSIEKMTSRLNNTAGAITLSNKGDVGIGFSSKKMSWAYIRGTELHYGVYPGQDEKEDFIL